MFHWWQKIDFFIKKNEHKWFQRIVWASRSSCGCSTVSCTTFWSSQELWAKLTFVCSFILIERSQAAAKLFSIWYKVVFDGIDSEQCDKIPKACVKISLFFWIGKSRRCCIELSLVRRIENRKYKCYGIFASLILENIHLFQQISYFSWEESQFCLPMWLCTPM